METTTILRITCKLHFYKSSFFSQFLYYRVSLTYLFVPLGFKLNQKLPQVLSVKFPEGHKLIISLFFVYYEWKSMRLSFLYIITNIQGRNQGFVLGGGANIYVHISCVRSMDAVDEAHPPNSKIPRVISSLLYLKISIIKKIFQ